MTAECVHHFLECSASEYPDKVAYIQDDVRATYSEINELSNYLAASLISSGVSVGDRVVILLNNCLDYVISYYGILKAGAVAVPLSVDTKAATLRNLLTQLAPTVIIHTNRIDSVLHSLTESEINVRRIVVGNQASLRHNSSFTEEIRAGSREVAFPTINSSNLASIIYTSGSTGTPKGVMLSHGNIVSNTRSIVRYLHLTSADIQMTVLPFFYVMGKSLLNTHFAVGGTIVVNNKFAYPACVLEQMVKEQVTGFSGVPSTFAYLLYRSPLRTYKNKLSTLRYVTQAGGHMPRSVKEELLQVLPAHTQLYIMYGATEAAARLTFVEPERLIDKIESIGIPISGVELKIMNSRGQELPVGEVGELVAAGSNIMIGYWQDEIATNKVLDAHGYHTGDLGFCDADGYFYVVGRKDNVVKVGGHRINPVEVEDILMDSGMLIEAVVLPVPDELLGNRLVGIVVPQNNTFSENHLMAFCAAKLPRHKLPSQVIPTRLLPKNANGKIDSQSCLDLIAQHPV